jgi:FkbM family methyltransferase
MRDRGYHPRLVIDGGAHLGSFAIEARSIFPSASFHLVEPQKACADALTKLAASNGFTFHQCALSDKVGQVALTQGDVPNTGVHIEGEDGLVSASTLDALFGEMIIEGDRTLLKLDLQGYELHALRGASKTLRSIEIVLTEASFYAQAYEPSILELMNFLDQSGFQLYDVAAIAGRWRDNRAHQGDLIFARKGSRLLFDTAWE